jgi:hypothetical protein
MPKVTIQFTVESLEAKFLMALHSALVSSEEDLPFDSDLSRDDLPAALMFIQDVLSLTNADDFSNLRWSDDERKFIANFSGASADLFPDLFKSKKSKHTSGAKSKRRA